MIRVIWNELFSFLRIKALQEYLLLATIPFEIINLCVICFWVLTNQKKRLVHFAQWFHATNQTNFKQKQIYREHLYGANAIRKMISPTCKTIHYSNTFLLNCRACIFEHEMVCFVSSSNSKSDNFFFWFCCCSWHIPIEAMKKMWMMTKKSKFQNNWAIGNFLCSIAINRIVHEVKVILSVQKYSPKSK